MIERPWEEFYRGKEASFTMTNASINLDLLQQLCQPQLPQSYDIIYPKVVQVRKHKKKRINKKWLKRYGYKIIHVTSQGWKITTYTDGSFEIVK